MSFDEIFDLTASWSVFSFFIRSNIYELHTVVVRGVADLYILDEDTQLVIRAIGVSHTASCKDEFRRNL